MCKWGTESIIKLAYPMSCSGRKEISVDSCLAKLIQTLNEYKIHTLGCCCGHGKAHGSVLIHPDNFEITEFGYCELKFGDGEKMTNKAYLEAIDESKDITN
ncbi:MAG: hypothetical protein M0R03_16990 [Novosphingobium sp.]|nr:hypothetical protein [Novosphingobium sp.]